MPPPVFPPRRAPSWRASAAGRRCWSWPPAPRWLLRRGGHGDLPLQGSPWGLAQHEGAQGLCPAWRAALPRGRAQRAAVPDVRAGARSGRAPAGPDRLGAEAGSALGRTAAGPARRADRAGGAGFGRGPGAAERGDRGGVGIPQRCPLAQGRAGPDAADAGDRRHAADGGQHGTGAGGSGDQCAAGFATPAAPAGPVPGRLDLALAAYNAGEGAVSSTTACRRMPKRSSM